MYCEKCGMKFDVVGEGKVAYYDCKNCKNRQSIDNHTTIIRVIDDQSSREHDSINYDHRKHNPILLHTTKYICSNPNCPTHKDPSKRDAVINHIENTNKIINICLVCTQ